ncbi:MAG: UDP-3-O-acyl-N-acetylglucosamine deacetylase [Vampirovibrionales bacterium]
MPRPVPSFVRELPALQAQGLAKGVSLDNTLGLTDEGGYTAELRLPDEPLRHKVLDLIGDLDALRRAHYRYLRPYCCTQRRSHQPHGLWQTAGPTDDPINGDYRLTVDVDTVLRYCCTTLMAGIRCPGSPVPQNPTILLEYKPVELPVSHTPPLSSRSTDRLKQSV